MKAPLELREKLNPVEMAEKQIVKSSAPDDVVQTDVAEIPSNDCVGMDTYMNIENSTDNLSFTQFVSVLLESISVFLSLVI